MPVVALVNPVTNEVVPLKEAVEKFESQGVCPAEITRTLLNDLLQGSYREGTHLSPSMLDEETNCPREVALQRFDDFALEPGVLWSALEGTIWHQAFSAAGAGDDWILNLELPGEEDEGKPGVTVMERAGRKVRYLEVWPGINLHGSLDRVSKDLTIISDHKTTVYPWTRTFGGPPMDFSDKKVGNWAIQLGLYRIMLERLRGVKVKRLQVWRMYRGSRSKTDTFRLLPGIPILTDEELRGRVEPYARRLLGYLTALVEAKPEDREQVLASIPMDGYTKKMFNDKKCSQYCGTQRKCYELAGLLTF